MFHLPPLSQTTGMMATQDTCLEFYDSEKSAWLNGMESYSPAFLSHICCIALSLLMESFFFLVCNNGSISVPIPPKCHRWLGFSSSLLLQPFPQMSPALFTSATHQQALNFSGNGRLKKKRRGKTSRKKIRDKGRLTYRTIWQRPGGPRDHVLWPWQIGLQKSSPRFETGFSSKLCAANWLIFWTFSKYVCKAVCRIFKAKSMDRPPTLQRALERGPAYWKAMFQETDVLPLRNCISPRSLSSASSPIPGSVPALQMLSPGQTWN